MEIRRESCRVAVNVLESDIEVSEFEIHSCYYVHLLTYTLRKSMNPQVVD